MESEIQQITQTLFKHLNISINSSVTFDQETEYYTINLETESTGLVIGYRGETLSSIQQILSHLIKHQTGNWHKIIVNLAGYREQREQTLIQLAENAAKRVLFSGESYTFTNLTPPERRIVHMTLQDNQLLKTESTGQGKNRQLTISKK